MIPRRIHLIWLNRDAGDDSIPEPYRSFIDGWVARHPGWDVAVYRTRQIAEHCPLLGATMLRLLAAGEHPALVSDLMRAELIYRYGGFYVDADIECIKSLEPLRACDTLLARELPGDAVCSGLFADIPNGIFSQLLIDDIVANGQSLHGGSIAAWTRACQRLQREHPENATVVLPPASFFPFYSTYVPDHLVLSEECFGIHWYAATWTGETSEYHQSFRRAIRRFRGVVL